MNGLVFLLGAIDPEMHRITQLLGDCGVSHIRARQYGKLVTPKTAYDANGSKKYLNPSQRVVFVECRDTNCQPFRIIDHHEIDDPGFDIAACQFPLGSSLGQVWSLLVDEEIVKGVGSPDNDAQSSYSGWVLADGAWHLFDKEGRRVQVPKDHLMAMAADHCLTFAYNGECPGIDPAELLDWRVSVRALFQGRTEEDVQRDIVNCIDYLESVENMDYRMIAGEKIVNVVNMPELTDAAAIKKINYSLESVDRSLRNMKIKIRARSKNTIQCWMQEMQSQGLDQVYGNPIRGYAGASHRLK